VSTPNYTSSGNPNFSNMIVALRNGSPTFRAIESYYASNNIPVTITTAITTGIIGTGGGLHPLSETG
jgi:hypothetical protein